MWADDIPLYMELQKFGSEKINLYFDVIER